MLAILILNGGLLLDYYFVKDPRWRAIVLRTLYVTPLALLVNMLMRAKPPGWVREGSVAAGTTLICMINLYVEGNRTAPTTTYGLFGVLITVLFVDVVMRLRLLYAVFATVAMTFGGLWFLYQATGLQAPEKVIAASLLAIGIAITLATGYSLEREERLGYLLHLRSEVQAEELAALNSQLQQLSSVDKLTGLPNRRAFEERFEILWTQAEQSRTPLGVVLLDVDDFKALNDRCGHLHGDKVLQHIATLLPQGLRGHEDFAARFGGEEFVILLPKTDLHGAFVVAERIRRLVEAMQTYTSTQMSMNGGTRATISCGVATRVPQSNDHREELLKTADQALYDAKASGRNRVNVREIPLL